MDFSRLELAPLGWEDLFMNRGRKRLTGSPPLQDLIPDGAGGPGKPLAYPQRPVTLIIGGPQGAGTDILVRRLSEQLSALLGQRVIIEYRLGASGNLAAMAVAQAEPDGYTILMATRSPMLHKAIYPHLQYDFARDLTPVAMIGSLPIGILVGNHVGAANFCEFVRLAKETPGRFSVATLGVGTTDHLVSVLIQATTGIQLQHVPYMEVSRALKDVVGGRVDLLFTQLSGGISHMNAGSVQALAVTSPHASANLPVVPTVAEAGLAEVNVDDWFVAMAPSHTPSDIIATLNDAVNQALTDQDLRDDLTKLGYVLPWFADTPDGLQDFLTEENMVWTQVLKDHRVIGFQ